MDDNKLAAIVEEYLPLLGSTKEKLVIGEILTSLLKLITSHPYAGNWELFLKLINASKHLLLTHSSNLIKRHALVLLAHLAPVANDSEMNESVLTSEMQSEFSVIVKILREFSHYFDPRVRSAALNAIYSLHQRGAKLDISLYCEFCEGLTDDYEDCRMASIKLMEVLSHNYADCLVCVGKGDEQIRLVDDAFAKICSMMNDLSIRVRVQAASILGNFTDVAPDFLEQTLDKKLMSNLRKKRSAHERSRENFKSGEWSSGKKWADDAPLEELDPEAINLMDIGACGAFIHGLEDEFLEVRMASLESLCKLAISFPSFAQQSLDFLVDMFNDEIEDIRLKAIQCLSRIGQQNITLRDDQIDIILGVLEDMSIDIREALHDMLGNCKLSSKQSLKACIEKLLYNLRRYPEDKHSLWKCFQKLGTNHPNLVDLIVHELLMIHPFLDLPEPSLEDDAYISVLILVFNAAALCPSITKVFLPHTFKHYSYLQYSYPQEVPHIPDIDSGLERKREQSQHCEGVSESAMSFLSSIFERIRNIMSSPSVSLETQAAVIELSIGDLEKFGEIESSMSHASDFLKQYLKCQMSLRKILSNNNWINTFLLSPLQSNSFRSSLQQILQTTFCLIHQFHGLHPFHLSLILQTRVKALALQLIAVIHGSNQSALTLCDAFLEEVKTLQTHLKLNGMDPDPLTKEMIQEVNKLSSPKPGSVARALQPLFLSSPKLISQAVDLTQLVSSNTIEYLEHLRKSSACINEPNGRSDNPLKFTAGLILTVRLDAMIYNIKDIKTIRLMIHSPDQTNNFILPKLSDFRLMDNNSREGDNRNYRLLTNIYLSHTVWTEPCHVSISIVSDFRETASSFGISQTWASKTGSGIRARPEESLIIELCKPIKLLIAPKQHKKGF